MDAEHTPMKPTNTNTFPTSAFHSRRRSMAELQGLFEPKPDKENKAAVLPTKKSRRKTELERLSPKQDTLFLTRTDRSARKSSRTSTSHEQSPQEKTTKFRNRRIAKTKKSLSPNNKSDPSDTIGLRKDLFPTKDGTDNNSGSNEIDTAKLVKTDAEGSIKSSGDISKEQATAPRPLVPFKDESSTCEYKATMKASTAHVLPKEPATIARQVIRFKDENSAPSGSIEQEDGDFAGVKGQVKMELGLVDAKNISSTERPVEGFVTNISTISSDLPDRKVPSIEAVPPTPQVQRHEIETANQEPVGLDMSTDNTQQLAHAAAAAMQKQERVTNTCRIVQVLQAKELKSLQTENFCNRQGFHSLASRVDKNEGKVAAIQDTVESQGRQFSEAENKLATLQATSDSNGSVMAKIQEQHQQQWDEQGRLEDRSKKQEKRILKLESLVQSLKDDKEALEQTIQALREEAEEREDASNQKCRFGFW